MWASGCSLPARSIWGADGTSVVSTTHTVVEVTFVAGSGGFVARVGLDGLPDARRRALDRGRHAVLGAGLRLCRTAAGRRLRQLALLRRLRRPLAGRPLGLRRSLVGGSSRGFGGGLRRPLARRAFRLRLLLTRAVVGLGGSRLRGSLNDGSSLGSHLRRPLTAALRLRLRLRSLLLTRAVVGRGNHGVPIRIGVALRPAPPARRL